jgi:predicted DNA-binding transcriptional regulator YafY
MESRSKAVALTALMAIQEGWPLAISYEDSQGTRTKRLIDVWDALEDRVVGYCRMRQARREFLYSRILAVGIVFRPQAAPTAEAKLSALLER